MKPSPGKALATVALCMAGLSWGGAAQAMAPLPKTLIDRSVRAPQSRLELQRLIPEWADLSGPLAGDDHALGYFEVSVHRLAERFDGNPGRHLAHAYGHSKRRARPGEDARPRGGRPDVPGENRSPSDDPVPVFVERPMFPEPIRAGFGRRPSGPSGQQGQGEVPEPSGPMLLVMALTGLFVTSKRGKVR
jgi:hypothetical protein